MHVSVYDTQYPIWKYKKHLKKFFLASSQLEIKYLPEES